MKRLLALLFAIVIVLSSCSGEVPGEAKSLTENLLSLLSEDDFEGASALLDSESGLGENNIRSYIYALEAETDCDFSNGARIVEYGSYSEYTDESSADEERELHLLKADIKVGTIPFLLTLIIVDADDGPAVYDVTFEMK